MRLFIDANVLFRAAISPDGNGRALIELGRAGACVVTSSAVAGMADLLVTGDRRHFGGLVGRSPRGVTVLPPREALERVLSG